MAEPDEPCTHAKIHRVSHPAPGEHGFVFTWECWSCSAPFVEGSKLQDALKDVAHYTDMANQANVACIGLQSRLDNLQMDVFSLGVAEDKERQLRLAAERRLDSAEKRLREACCVDHNWRASTFIEYSTPHWVCNNCGKAEGKKYDEWYSQVRTTMTSGAASNTAVLSNESAGPHSEAAPVVERRE